MSDTKKTETTENENVHLQPSWIRETLQECSEDGNAPEEVQCILKAGEDLSVTDLSEQSDGHFNYVMRVESKLQPNCRSIVLKHSPPFARLFPNFQVPPQRSRLEFRALEKFDSIVPGCVPKPYCYNQIKAVVCMEDMQGYTLYRKALVLGDADEDMARTLARNLATIHGHTHVRNIGQEELDKTDREFDNPFSFRAYHRALFDIPYDRNQIVNRYAEVLVGPVEAVVEDKEYMAALADVQKLYTETREALTHGDMHSSAAMVKDRDVKMFDLECARVGSCAKDIGGLLGDYCISHFYHRYHPDATAPKHKQMVQDLPQICRATVEEYLEHLVLKNVDTEQYNKQFMSECSAYAALLMIVRLLRNVKSEEVDTMESGLPEILHAACRLLKAHKRVHSITDMLDIVLTQPS